MMKNIDGRKTKNFRSINIYVRLCEGKVICKSDEASRFGVDERSIQRDIDDIRAYLDEQSIESGDSRKVIYDRIKKGFVMVGQERSMMTNSEILAISKILLESRAFTKKELGIIIDKLLTSCVPIKNMKIVSDLIANEKYHYVELKHKEYINNKLWNIGYSIHDQNLVSIKYSRANNSNESVNRIIEPLAILFSEYYFYLNAYIVKNDMDGKYKHKYDYPAVFRIDRIKEYTPLKEKFSFPYADRFEEGEFRKRVQFMYPGELQRMSIKYFGDNPEPILDRLPTARIVKKYEHECVIDAEVYGKGIIMWLLSQGNNIEVIKPESMREEIKNTLKSMLTKYQ
ncbi:helix-turn-helix transcriptional regulator [Oribacterium sp. P6A1]|uniref:helix-turn-helix transcriptional regulator n=1 Tax=Oribacterium sp. P6A1 TaxID=1410612 RepID=UPI000B0301CF|nr:WYL domain-containing protein [Oribacterium sp. P6A1]